MHLCCTVNSAGRDTEKKGEDSRNGSELVNKADVPKRANGPIGTQSDKGTFLSISAYWKVLTRHLHLQIGMLKLHFKQEALIMHNYTPQTTPNYIFSVQS